MDVCPTDNEIFSDETWGIQLPSRFEMYNQIKINGLLTTYYVAKRFHSEKKEKVLFWLLQCLQMPQDIFLKWQGRFAHRATLVQPLFSFCF